MEKKNKQRQRGRSVNDFQDSKFPEDDTAGR
jgi:hypothetical protein